eukprot:TRINITY_DN4180_c0_g2_i1.p1 TRINITY_DN4180_c0_g2~~TRINITY_DN4180_c0_g2_i1.p1  ORF type:complete len:634 (+),score=120.22 TRINITY_DN4180_c0_g2_i1:94-1995(+)
MKLTRGSLLFVAILLIFQLYTTQAFYIPGVAPHDYEPDEDVDLKVNKMTSIHTQMPYSYYSLPFCRPKDIEDARENLGEMLLGDKIENSLYLLQAKHDYNCRVVCNKTYTQHQIKEFAEKVQQEYRVHWIVDNLPSATRRFLSDESGHPVEIYEAGFPLGEMSDGTPILNNHVNIVIQYHPNTDETVRIVGFEVKAESINHRNDYNPLDVETYPSSCPKSTDDLSPVILDVKATSLNIIWTYSVTWKQSDIPWSSRWDSYLMMTDDQIHWFSIINSVMIVLFLTGMVAMIMMRTLHRDIGRYKEQENSGEEAPEETGWKLVHGDVFRPPNHPMLLAVSVGTGIQTLCMTVSIMLFAVLGFLSPANRGGLMTAMVVILVLMGVVSGYFSARNYKVFKGKMWKKMTLMAAFLYPGIAFGIFFFNNAILGEEDSSGAVPWYILLELFALWFGVSVPLTFLGAFFGFKKPVAEPPIRINQIPRQIPEQIWYMKPIFSILMGGILPFGAIFIELFFILSSIWLHQFYYLFGFLFIVLIILVITCAEITVVMCYFQLCAEDYHWWWRGYLTAGASALYMFIYAILYYFTKLTITSFVSSLLYFGYTLIMTMYVFLFTGTVGYYACFFFVYKIYSEIHAD